ncbi:hypothetical protein [Prosthecobacter sp.]|uniref:hypothetical protein n=1 Tax=Prosthecobacter sp. TaxID=1965333 RepID=UPI00387E923A
MSAWVLIRDIFAQLNLAEVTKELEEAMTKTRSKQIRKKSPSASSSARALPKATADPGMIPAIPDLSRSLFAT